jgi:hypothetical protein
MQNDLYQNLPKIGPAFSHIDEKQGQVVNMIKRYDVAPQLKVKINQDIPGLRKKKRAASEARRRNLFQLYIEELSEALHKLTGRDKDDVRHRFTEMAFELTADADFEKQLEEANRQKAAQLAAPKDEPADE